MRLNQPAAKVELVVWDEDGKIIHRGATDFAGPAPGTPLTVTWEPTAGAKKPIKLGVKVHSSFGFWVGTDVAVWEEHIPHEEVNFAFGRADIPAEEAPKLDKAVGLILEKVNRYKGFLTPQLYVAGHTDTVGPRASNRALSEARARAIGAYLRKRGIAIPIFCTGYGEDALAVKTPDETREAKNRRAEYILSVGPPTTQGPAPGWKSL